jgi:chromosome segregation ATPase
MNALIAVTFNRTLWMGQLSREGARTQDCGDSSAESEITAAEAKLAAAEAKLAASMARQAAAEKKVAALKSRISKVSRVIEWLKELRSRAARSERPDVVFAAAKPEWHALLTSLDRETELQVDGCDTPPRDGRDIKNGRESQR